MYAILSGIFYRINQKEYLDKIFLFYYFDNQDFKVIDYIFNTKSRNRSLRKNISIIISYSYFLDLTVMT